MSPIPKARDDDPEDVSWALSTAATQFARGDRAEALKWLRRAAEAASEAERDSRALELAKAAADLSTAPPITQPPKAVSTKPAPRGPTTKRLSIKPPKPEEKKPDDKKTRPRTPSNAEDRADTQITRPPLPHIVSAGTPETPEADGWVTESMGASDLDALQNEVYGTERTRIGAAAYKPEKSVEEPKKPAFRASQAVHVVIWRAPDGTLRLAAKGTVVSAVTIDALLVAPGPDVDLLAWLSPT